MLFNVYFCIEDIWYYLSEINRCMWFIYENLLDNVKICMWNVLFIELVYGNFLLYEKENDY